MIILVTVIMPVSLGDEIGVKSHDIEITTEDNRLSIIENINLSGLTNETNELTLWIQQNSQDIELLIDDEEYIYYNREGNEIICNISSIRESMNIYTQVVLSYTLNKDIKEFEKTLKYTTDQISVLYDRNKIFTENNLQSDISFTLMLYKPSETPLSGYMIMFIILLVILLIVSTFYSFRKQKAVKIKDIVNESEELLQAKKTLLMASLKDIEKQHRGKKISDDTYHKLKNYYKQQAVDAMKKLDDIESKLK